MQAPITLEEQTFRSNFSDRVTAISNVNSLFSDVEDKARRLTILKSLVGSLHLGDEIVAEIQKEIESAKEFLLIIFFIFSSYKPRPSRSKYSFSVILFYTPLYGWSSRIRK